MRCPICNTQNNQAIIIQKFEGDDCGHIYCRCCGASYDSNAIDVSEIQITTDKINDINTEYDYRKLFIESWEIADSKGDIYPEFEWKNNELLKRGVSDYIIKSIEEYYDSKNLKILDLGCGNGFTSLNLAEKYGKHNVIAIDPSHLVEKLNDYGIKAIRGTLDTVRLGNCEVDVVVVVGNLMLHTNPINTMSEIHRILRPGGLAIVDFKNIRCTSRILARYLLTLLPSLSKNTLLQRNFYQMRYGFHRGHISTFAPKEKFDTLCVFGKPPRRLEFSNKSSLATGLTGLLWRLLGFIDKLRNEEAWLQVVLKKV